MKKSDEKEVLETMKRVRQHIEADEKRHVCVECGVVFELSAMYASARALPALFFVPETRIFCTRCQTKKDEQLAIQAERDAAERAVERERKLRKKIAMRKEAKRIVDEEEKEAKQ